MSYKNFHLLATFSKKEKSEIIASYSALKAIYPLEDYQILDKAFQFALGAHGDKRCQSGVLHIWHPLRVGHLVRKELNLGPTSIPCALLCDLSQQTSRTIEEIKKQFGEIISKSILRLSKEYGIRSFQGLLLQEDYKNFLENLFIESRCLLIKMAIVLDAAEFALYPQAQKTKFFKKIINYWIPLAHRLELNNLKTRLENVYFEHTHPEIYKALATKLGAQIEEKANFMENFIAPLQDALARHGLKTCIEKRLKSYYSIWKKSQIWQIPPEELLDIMAFRIIVESEEKKIEEAMKCWQVCNLMGNFYEFHPIHFRDFISNPKKNGYQSMHLTVMSPKGLGHWAEVQIRTGRMDAIAKRGEAAHWHYKENKNEVRVSIPNEYIYEIKDFMKRESVQKTQILAEEIAVFDELGNLQKVPSLSTVLDWAIVNFGIKAFQCNQAFINGKAVPWDTLLEHGNRVSVTMVDAMPSEPAWKKCITPMKYDYVMQKNGAAEN